MNRFLYHIEGPVLFNYYDRFTDFIFSTGNVFLAIEILANGHF